MYFFDSIMYPFNSDRLVGKLLTGLLLIIIPIINIFGGIILAGYGIKVMRHVMQGDKNLPEFEFGDDFMRGLMVIVGIIVWIIPIVILTIIITLVFGDNILGVFLSMIISLLYTPLQIVAIAKYAASDELGSFFQFGEIFETVTSNMGYVLMLYVNLIAFSFVMGIGIMLGFLLLVIPGVILAVASTFAQYHLIATFAQQVGIGARKSKPKNDEFAF